VIYFQNFGTSSISLEQLELETSNLVCILTTRDTHEINAMLNQCGPGRGHVTYFQILGPFHLLGTVGIGNFKFDMQID